MPAFILAKTIATPAEGFPAVDLRVPITLAASEATYCGINAYLESLNEFNRVKPTAFKTDTPDQPSATKRRKRGVEQTDPRTTPIMISPALKRAIQFQLNKIERLALTPDGYAQAFAEADYLNAGPLLSTLTHTILDTQSESPEDLMQFLSILYPNLKAPSPSASSPVLKTLLTQLANRFLTLRINVLKQGDLFSLEEALDHAESILLLPWITTLNLPNMGLEPQHCRFLNNLIGRIPSLEAVSLEENSLGIGCQKLTNLAKSPNLLTLNLASNDIEDMDLRTLADLPLEKLTGLTLKDNGLSAEGIGLLDPEKLPQLAQLDLDGNYLTPDTLDHLCDVTWPTLKRLSLSNMMWENDPDAILKFNGQAFPALIELNLADNNLSDSQLSTLLNNRSLPRTLEQVNLSTNRLIGTQAYPFHQLPKLRHLNLSSTPLKTQAIQSAFGLLRNPELRTLDISQTRFNEADLARLVTQFKVNADALPHFEKIKIGQGRFSAAFCLGINQSLARESFRFSLDASVHTIADLDEMDSE